MTDRPLPEHDDLGAPVTELKGLRVEPSPEFLARIRGRIHRRLFAGDTIDFMVQALFRTILDYVDLAVRALLPGTRAPRKEND
jgi:hypothetical protein